MYPTIRRVATARVRTLAVQSGARSYATFPREEPDPQLNGYPELPSIPRQNLPPLGWTDNLTRRNFGDTLHEQDEVLSMWGPDAPPLPPTTALRQLLIAISGFVAAGFAIKALTPDPPAVRREYPFGGLIKELGGLEENQARPEINEADN
ncbi:hypothetical protein HYPSUDRAFT_36721 [Hypholoma sublateritium FD-334 SS-4]|uniref:Uncharacterized protein n=1 Tax=Hypholoma sublateritium (strain FD-334 SS-4) TaxID=945553 RepID=A0A0D2LFH1_HYPSF|nr:hypothetical protein HYPSUDRAFT_36721 [Hypholoma sublateritium FD-334 SS-4]